MGFLQHQKQMDWKLEKTRRVPVDCSPGRKNLPVSLQSAAKTRGIDAAKTRVNDGKQALGSRLACLSFKLCGVAHEDVAQRHQALDFLPVNNGQMAEAEFAHDEQAFFDALTRVDSARIG